MYEVCDCHPWSPCGIQKRVIDEKNTATSTWLPLVPGAFPSRGLFFWNAIALELSKAEVYLGLAMELWPCPNVLGALSGICMWNVRSIWNMANVEPRTGIHMLGRKTE